MILPKMTVLVVVYAYYVYVLVCTALFGGSGRDYSYHITLTKDWCISPIWDGHPLSLSAQLWEECIWNI